MKTETLALYALGAFAAYELFLKPKTAPAATVQNLPAAASTLKSYTTIPASQSNPLNVIANAAPALAQTVAALFGTNKPAPTVAQQYGTQPLSAVSENIPAPAFLPTSLPLSDANYQNGGDSFFTANNLTVPDAGPQIDAIVNASFDAASMGGYHSMIAGLLEQEIG